MLRLNIIAYGFYKININNAHSLFYVLLLPYVEIKKLLCYNQVNYNI